MGPAFKDKDKEKYKDKVKEKGERQIQILEAGVTKDRNYSVGLLSQRKYILLMQSDLLWLLPDTFHQNQNRFMLILR